MLRAEATSDQEKDGQRLSHTAHNRSYRLTSTTEELDLVWDHDIMIGYLSFLLERSSEAML